MANSRVNPEKGRVAATHPLIPVSVRRKNRDLVRVGIGEAIVVRPTNEPAATQRSREMPPLGIPNKNPHRKTQDRGEPQITVARRRLRVVLPVETHKLVPHGVRSKVSRGRTQPRATVFQVAVLRSAMSRRKRTDRLGNRAQTPPIWSMPERQPHWYSITYRISWIGVGSIQSSSGSLVGQMKCLPISSTAIEH